MEITFTNFTGGGNTDLPEILLIIAGIGLLLWAIGIVIYFSKSNDPFYNYSRYSPAKPVFAVYSDNGRIMRFERYDPIKYPVATSVTVPEGNIIMQFSDTEVATAVREQIQPNRVEEKQYQEKIIVHMPGDRFKDII